MGIEWLKPAAFIGSIVYALIGVIIFWLCFVIIDKITPYNLWEEIVVKQNRALALVVAFDEPGHLDHRCGRDPRVRRANHKASPLYGPVPDGTLAEPCGATPT
jgi:putative membrane protein